MPTRQLTYPFSAIVGQEDLKLVLVLNAIDPKIGGLLISGTKGTGKSLAAKAFADILPEVETVEDCEFNCNPNDSLELCSSCRSRLMANEPLPTRKRRISMIQLPISATEDRLIGSVNIEAALREGKKVFQPGILAEANQNILYIDEVNLLPDNLVNCFLDPAASGWNVVQREGASFSHPSRFTLIASMDPEEGELRPQILDRFPLSVRTETVTDLELRAEITARNASFEEDPLSFYSKFAESQEKLREKIVAARELLPKVAISDQIIEGIAKACVELEVDGSRPDIAVTKAAKALAALKGRTAVVPEDVVEVSGFALAHRTRKQGSEEPPDKRTIVSRLRESLARVEIPDKKEAPSKIQSEKDVLDLLRTPPPPTRHIRRRKESRLFQLVYPLFVFGLVFFMYFSIVVLTSYFYSMFTGASEEDFSGMVTLDHIWPYLTLLSVATMIAPIILNLLPGKQKTIVPIYLYQASNGGIERRIVRQIRPRPRTSPITRLGTVRLKFKEPPPSPTRILNMPIRASLSKLYKMFLNRGPRIAKDLKQLREGSQRYKFSLAEKLRKMDGGVVGKRIRSITSHHGHYVYSKLPEKKPWDIALAPTIRAAAPFQAQQDHAGLSVTIKPRDVRVKMRESRAPLTIVLLLDMSESMAASLNNIRNAVLSLHDIAYKKRDRIALVVFKGYGATVLQLPTINLGLIESKLLDVGTSDFTPLAAGMFEAWRILRNEKTRNKETTPILVVISDGIANIPLERPLTSSTREKFVNAAQADVVDAAGLLQREKIQTIIINTAHEEKTSASASKYAHMISTESGRRWLDPTSFLLEVTRITGGYYYGIGEGGNLETTVLMDAFTLMDKGRRPRF